MTGGNLSDENAVSRVEAWLAKAAMPLWRSVGITASGLAAEELDFSGRPKNVGYHRTMVQFRQVVCFAQAGLMSHADPELARILFHRVAHAAWHVDGGWVHTLDADGNILDETRDACDQAFALLAAAWVFRQSGDERALDRARATLAFLDRYMTQADGSFADAVPARLPRRQNSQMHLMEAFLALYEVTGERAFLAHAGRMISLLIERYVDASGFLHEFFDEDWTRRERAADGVEPGHHFEWVWLLHEYERLSGISMRDCTQKLFSAAVQHGMDAGWAVAQIDPSGRVLDGTKMLWAQTEMLKAHIARIEHAREDHGEFIAHILDGLFRCFLSTTPQGIWHEKLDADGAPVRARMPASTFYHLTGAFMEFLRFQGQTQRLLRART